MSEMSRTAQKRLHALITRELLVPGGERPETVETAEGSFVIAFDNEDLLARFATGPVERAILPGRVLVQALADQGVGIALNIGDATEHLFDAESLAWLNDVMATEAEESEAHLGDLTPPHASPEFFDALDEAISRLTGIATTIWLFRNDGVLTLAVAGVDPRAETAVTRAFSDAVGVAGWAEAFSVLFADLSETPGLDKAAIRVEIPQEEPPEPKPENLPPRLR